MVTKNPPSTPASDRGRLQDDCFRPGQARLRHAEALEVLRSRIRPIAAVEVLRLGEAQGRTLAEDVVAGFPVPSHTNSAVDGYAFLSSPEVRDNGGSFPVVGRAAAGHPYKGAIPASAAVRIFTGAVMPEGADTVVMQEDAAVSTGDGANGAASSLIHVPGGLKPGANVRKAGEDVAAGRVLFEAGHVLRPQDVAALASIGCGEVRCYGRLKIGIISTGDEIVMPGRGALAPGQVYDANAPMLSALAALAGAECEHLGIWPDRRETVIGNLAEAAARFDVLLTSGGASLGEEDHMAAALAESGSRHLWQLAIKPGRPMMFGQVTGASKDTIVVGLPGNPVAVFVCFLMYVHPMLRGLGGATWREPRRYHLPAAFSFEGRKTGRREFWRGILVERDGRLSVDKFARDGSGLISGLTAASGLIDIPEDHGDVREGDLVPFIPLGEFGIA